MAERTCGAGDCRKAARGTLCAMHGARLRRTGSLDLLPRRRRETISTSGYRTTDKQYEHRIVLRAVIGEEPHPCHWCNRMLTWGGDLHVDHVDYDKLNNDPHNLVPSCQPCNNRRARHWAHGMTHCRRGHEFTPENTRLNRAGGRVCKECHRLGSRRYKERKRLTRSPRWPHEQFERLAVVLADDEHAA